MTPILTYALNALWQVPLVALAAMLMAPLAARTFPHHAAAARHRVWVGALLLQVILPACTMPTSLYRIVLQALSSLAAGGRSTHITVSYATITAAHGPSWLHLPDALFPALTLAYAAATLYFLLRLLHGLIRTQLILRDASDLTLTLAQALALQQATGPGTNVRVAASSALPGPVTLGLIRPVLLLPRTLLASAAQADLAALLAHEGAHIRRHDFALNLVYTALAVPIAFHPALWFTRARLTETREMVCDSVAACAVAGPESYTQSLLRLAESLAPRRPASPLHAIGFLDANSFERRLMHLTQLTTQPLVPSRLRRTLLASACAVIALATCASALALHLEAPAPSGQARVSGGVMAGHIHSRVAPIYPAEAKANHDTVDGPVVLHAIIGKDGTIQQINVQQSLRRDYDISALEAVRQWVYEPYLLNGEPTEVETTITVNYSIDHSHDKEAGKPAR